MQTKDNTFSGHTNSELFSLSWLENNVGPHLYNFNELNSADCSLTISIQQFQTELGPLRVEPYYLIYKLDARGRLSGWFLIDTATIISVTITAERLEA